MQDQNFEKENTSGGRFFFFLLQRANLTGPLQKDY
jgi:hypothetical protein